MNEQSSTYPTELGSILFLSLLYNMVLPGEPADRRTGGKLSALEKVTLLCKGVRKPILKLGILPQPIARHMANQKRQEIQAPTQRQTTIPAAFLEIKKKPIIVLHQDLLHIPAKPIPGLILILHRRAEEDPELLEIRKVIQKVLTGKIQIKKEEA